MLWGNIIKLVSQELRSGIPEGQESILIDEQKTPSACTVQTSMPFLDAAARLMFGSCGRSPVGTVALLRGFELGGVAL